jgi:hypothetical protein
MEIAGFGYNHFAGTNTFVQGYKVTGIATLGGDYRKDGKVALGDRF